MALRPDVIAWLAKHRTGCAFVLDEDALAERHLNAAADLDALAGPDLILAAACLANDATALKQFDELLVTEFRRAVTPFDTSNALVDEVTQLARERLLVKGKLAEYAGQGPLGAWLRAVAVRIALNEKRPAAREEATEHFPDRPVADPDPELALLRARHRVEFREAFEKAMRALTPRERTLLRLTTVDGLTLAQVGKMYGKDTSTASRWLNAARLTLRTTTRQTLAQTLKLTSAELESVLRVADSELQVSLVRMLKGSSS